MFRIDIYFTKYCLAIEIDEKGHTDRDLDSEKKKTRSIGKKNCKFIRINTTKENFDVDYEASRVLLLIYIFYEKKINSTTVDLYIL